MFGQSSRLVAVGLLCGFAGLSGQRAAASTAQACGPSAGFRFICGPTAAEDLVRVPDSKWLIASGMNVGKPAHLYLIDTAHKSSQILFPDPTSRPSAAVEKTPNCSGPPDLARLSLDGLALRAGAHGLHTLYAANHGDRMAIEFFNVDVRGSQPKIYWVGCAPLPAGTLPNAVTTLPDGGLLVISFYDPTQQNAWTAMAAGKPTGRILQWYPARGFEDVANSATSGGNGIETSADGKFIYASSWSSRELVVLSRQDGSRRAIALPFMPDNVHRQADGSLLIAGQRTSVAAIESCVGPTCPQPWVVARLDPRSGTLRTLLAGTGSNLVSYACGALVVNGTVYVTVRGDQRILYKVLSTGAKLAQ